jgi:hypothetical protein
MRAARLSAAILLLSIAAPGRAADAGYAPPLTFDSPAPPPPKYTDLTWRYGGTAVPGYWYTVQQIQATSARIDYLTDKASKECVDAQVKAAQASSAWWKVAVAVGAGAAIGYCAGVQNHCGLYK